MVLYATITIAKYCANVSYISYCIAKGEVPAISKGPIMVCHEKQYNTMGMVDNKQNVKVKEEDEEDMNTKVKRKQNKDEGDKKTEEKQNSSKREMAKYKDKKEKKARVVDKKDDKEKEREDRRK